MNYIEYLKMPQCEKVKYYFIEQAQKRLIWCDYCGKEFDEYGKVYSKNFDGIGRRFCSKECRSKYIKELGSEIRRMSRKGYHEDLIINYELGKLWGKSLNDLYN